MNRLIVCSASICLASAVLLSSCSSSHAAKGSGAFSSGSAQQLASAQTDLESIDAAQGGVSPLSQADAAKLGSFVVSKTVSFSLYDKVAGYSGIPTQFRSLGEVNGRLLLCSMDSSGSKLTFLSYSPAAGKVVKSKSYTLKKYSTFVSARLQSGKILLCFSSGYQYLNSDFTQVGGKELPMAVIDLTFIKNGFFGYNISPDGKTIVYCDKTGLWTYNLSTRKITPVAKTGSKSIFYKNPAFVDGGAKVAMTVFSGSTATGVALYMVASGKTQTIPYGNAFMSDAFSDGGLLSVQSKGAGGTANSFYVDFAKGTAEKLSGTDAPAGFSAGAGDSYVGKNYAAFLQTYTDGSSKKQVRYLFRVNLSTLAVESKIVEFTAGTENILGVTSDGRVLLSCSNGSSAQFLCLTAKAK